MFTWDVWIAEKGKILGWTRDGKIFFVITCALNVL